MFGTPTKPPWECGKSEYPGNMDPGEATEGWKEWIYPADLGGDPDGSDMCGPCKAPDPLEGRLVGPEWDIPVPGV